MMMNALLEATLRSLLMAATVWAGLRLLRVSHVMAQKMAWGLVLAAAVAMPFLMRWPMAPARSALVVPVYGLAPAMLAPAPRTLAPHVMLNPAHVAPKPAREVGGLKTSTVPDTPTTLMTPTAPDMPAALAMMPMRGHAVHESTWPALRPRVVMAALYFVAAGLFLLRVLFGLAMAFRLYRRAEPAACAGGPRDSVRISAAIDTPVTIGSCILLPASYCEWDEAKLRMVLAHERAHVRQGDFYLQLLATVYAAVFWFSPLGWLLLRKLSEMGEAISDRAALEEAATRSDYAELLLEFAAMPRRSPAGVAMAQASNLQQRIDRLLNERHFRLAFLSGRLHGVFAAALVPCALVAATSLVRVQAAEAVKPAQSALVQAEAATQPAPAQPAARALAIAQPAVHVTPLISPAPVVAASAAVQAKAAVRVTASIPAKPVVLRMVAPAMVAPTTALRSVSPLVSVKVLPPGFAAAFAEQAGSPAGTTDRGSYTLHSGDGDQDSYAVISGDSGSISGSGDFGADFAKVRSKAHGDYIWFKHDGKSYVIDDPSLVAQAKQLFKPMEELGRQQAALGEQQAQLGNEQARLGAMQGSTMPTPDISQAMAEAQTALKELELEKKPLLTQEELTAIQKSMRELQDQPKISMPDISTAMAAAEEAMKKWNLENKQFVNEAARAAVEERMAELQSRLGDVESKLGQNQAALGEQQSDLGKQQSKLGEQQSKLGEQQSRLSQENTRKMKEMFNDALRNGKAKPVE